MIYTLDVRTMLRKGQRQDSGLEYMIAYTVYT